MPNPAETKLVACIRHHFDQWRFPDWLTAAIRRRYPEMKVVHLPDYTGLDEEIRDADIYVGWSLKPEQIASAGKLKWIHATAAGVDQLMREDIRRSPVIVTNSSGVMPVPMAEHTLGLILALARRLPSAVRYQQQKHWAQQDIWDEKPQPMEINGRTLVIVGFGAIGRELARRARACEMRVVGVKRDPSRGGEDAHRAVGAGGLAGARWWIPRRWSRPCGKGRLRVLRLTWRSGNHWRRTVRSGKPPTCSSPRTCRQRRR